MSDTVTVHSPACPVCGKVSAIAVRQSDLDRWRAGALVQAAFPEMPLDQRELLQTGTHPACWDTLFPDE